MAKQERAIIKKTIAPILPETKKLKTNMVKDRLDCKGRAEIFCKQSGTATIKITMPDGSTHTIMEIDTSVAGNNVSRISVRVKASPVSKDRADVTG